ncbi:CRISPR-associated endonuclease Cas2 [Rubinisphaera italica]|uniref:CRISPR-associated endoribonuclease Cas2 n=1 Tax=Rubinisphaera italica TaxID=2527969 RepID=A0A5C5XPP6_9PLAN|nr:CRISPR-associated endonuclease Cas2 [Rubinisphaera italica]TWT63722.1 CRISPR-associated endoribonuclease Cas2 3 [Rubinisphaera italica]
MQWVIAYDISSDRRRRRVTRRLEQVGFRRQKSVFEGELKQSLMQDLMQELGSEIDPATDQLTAWSMSGRARGILHAGCPRAETQKDFHIL